MPSSINQVVGRSASNSHLIKIRSVVHKKSPDGFASDRAGDGCAPVVPANCRHVSVKVVKIRPSIEAFRNFHLNGLDVYGVVGSGKQGRKIEKLTSWFVGVVKVVAGQCRFRVNLPRVSSVVVLATPDATAIICGG